MNLINFNYNNIIVRTQVTDDGEPLFCLADICAVLELTNPTHTANAIKEEFSCPTLNVGQVSDPSGAKTVTFVTEPQLYFVLMRSRSDKAKPFRQWVVNEVLPSIRKTGKYESSQTKATPEPKKYALSDIVESAKIIFDVAGIEGAALALALDNVAFSETGKSLLKTADLQIAAPKQKVLLCPRDLGAPFGLSTQTVNSMLEANGLQHKKSDGKWEPTEEGKRLGAVLLFVNKKKGSGTPVTQLKWPSNILDQFVNV